MPTSREQLLTAVEHREQDRVLIDLEGNRTGIHQFAYDKLIGQLGLKEELAIMDVV